MNIYRAWRMVLAVAALGVAGMARAGAPESTAGTGAGRIQSRAFRQETAPKRRNAGRLPPAPDRDAQELARGNSGGRG